MFALFELLGPESSTAHGRAAKHLEKALGARQAAEPFGRRATRVIERLSAVRRQRLEPAGLCPPVEKIRRRDAEARPAAREIVLVDDHELLGLVVRQRLQQKRVGDGENRGVGPDAERERDDRHGRDARFLQQQPDAVPSVAQQILHHAVSLSFLQSSIPFQTVAPAHRSQVVDRRPPVPPAGRPGARPRGQAGVERLFEIADEELALLGRQQQRQQLPREPGGLRPVAHSASSARPSPRVSRRRLAHD